MKFVNKKMVNYKSLRGVYLYLQIFTGMTPTIVQNLCLITCTSVTFTLH